MEFKDYRVHIKVNYSDDSGQAVEQSVLIKPGTDYNTYIKACAKIFDVIAHTYGEDFEKAMEYFKAKEEGTPLKGETEKS